MLFRIHPKSTQHNNKTSFLLRILVNYGFFFVKFFLFLTLTSCISERVILKKKKDAEFNFQYDKDIDGYEQIISNLPIIGKDDKIKIAVMLPLSGKYKELGQVLMNAVVMSLFHNEKRRKIELIFFDTEGNRFGAKKAIKEVVKKNIKLAIGPIFSSCVKEISKTIIDNEIIVFSLSNELKIANPRGIFVSGFIFEKQIEEIVEYAISMNKDNFSIISPNNKFGIRISKIFKEFIKKKDGNFITSELYLSEKTLEESIKRLMSSFVAYNIEDDFKDVIINEDDEIIISNEDELKSNKKTLKNVEKIYSDVIFITDTGKMLSKIVELIEKYNINGRHIQIIGASNWGFSSTLGDPSLVGGWFVSPDIEKYKEFENNYYDIYEKSPLRISSVIYDVTSYLIHLINEKEDNLSLEDIIGDGDYEGFDGIDGKLRFLSNGLTERNMPILKVDDGQFVKIKDSIRFIKY